MSIAEPHSESSSNGHSSAASALSSAALRQLFIYFGAAIAGCTLLMFALHYLASAFSSGSTTAIAVDPENNSISIYLKEEPPSLNSTITTDSVSGMVLNHVMEGLLRMSVDDKLEAGIAERWEVTPTHATFWLRDNALWSDGQPITAADFIFSWTTALRPETASEYAFLLYSIKNGRAVNEGTMPAEALGVSAPDPHTLVVELEQPMAFFDKTVVFPTFFPIREDFYNATNGRFGADAHELLFSGPFKLTSWVHGSSLLFEKNPNYWDKERIKLDQINVAYITQDANAAINFFKDGKVAFTTLGAENLIEAQRQGWPIKRNQDGTLFFLEFNHRDERLTRNWNLRRAMQLVLDMDELVYKVTKLPGFKPGVSIFPEWLMGTNAPLREEYPPPQLRLDTAKAREHLALAKEELGLDEWPPIVLLTSDSPVSNIQSEWVQEALKSKLGLTIKIDKQIFKQRLAKMTAGEFDILLAGWGPDYNDPLTFGDLFASWNLNNRGRYMSDENDRLVREAQGSTDTKTRMDAFGKIQHVLFDDVALLPMFERGVTYAVHPQLKGLKRRVIGADTDYTNAYIDTGAGGQ